MKPNRSWNIEPDLGDKNNDSDFLEIVEKPRHSSFRLLLDSVIVLGIIGFGFLWWNSQQFRAKNQLKRDIQTILDKEQQAIEAGDGELFIGLQDNTPAWISEQLLPENYEILRYGLTVRDILESDNSIIVNVQWEEDEEIFYKTAFFEQRESGYVHTSPMSSNYWGLIQEERFFWGRLVFYSVDRNYAIEIGKIVGEIIKQICIEECLSTNEPLVIVLTNHYVDSHIRNTINLPSPRLVALTKDGIPSKIFWNELEDKVEHYIKPAVIKFAIIPNSSNSTSSYEIDYKKTALEFMSLSKDIKVELVFLDEIPDDLNSIPVEYDGASFPPTQEMITGGLVKDLTNFVFGDPEFVLSDFYHQPWNGTIFLDRVWWIPHGANLPLIFYDKNILKNISSSEPYLNWTWNEFDELIPEVLEKGKNGTEITWGLLDNGLNTLYSFAYSWETLCTNTDLNSCSEDLKQKKLNAAFEWYYNHVVVLRDFPELSMMNEADRKNILLNWQGARRKAAFWVDYPINYEFQLLLGSIGVVPFPGTENRIGITPLTVYGSFISQKTNYPLAMWEWLKFLSYQKPGSRIIPARKSVATKIRFWENLPPNLGNAMRIAFPYSITNRAGEQTTFSWEKIRAVVKGEISPYVAAIEKSRIIWFRSNDN